MKLLRALELQNELKALYLDFLSRAPYKIERGVDFEDGWINCRFRLREAPPDRLALLAGEMLQASRACLDHLVFQLALFTTPTPTGTQFPIFTNQREYLAPRGKNPSFREQYLAGVLDAHRTIIDSHQPFLSQRPEDHPLASLAWFTNVDKHRMVHPAFVMPHEVGVRFLPPYGDLKAIVEVPNENGRVDDGEVLLRFRPDPDDLRDIQTAMDVQLDCTIGLAFGDRLLPAEQLMAIGLKVTEIVDEFLRLEDNALGGTVGWQAWVASGRRAGLPIDARQASQVPRKAGAIRSKNVDGR
jgi:hypothetical protein